MICSICVCTQKECYVGTIKTCWKKVTVTVIYGLFLTGSRIKLVKGRVGDLIYYQTRSQSRFRRSVNTYLSDFLYFTRKSHLRLNSLLHERPDNKIQKTPQLLKHTCLSEKQPRVHLYCTFLTCCMLTLPSTGQKGALHEVCPRW